MVNKVGIRIREIRKSLKLTQKDLGNLCGIAEQTISRYECGSLRPKQETRIKIATALGVSERDLTGNQSSDIDLDQKYLEKLGYTISHEEDNINYTLSQSGYKATFTPQEFSDFQKSIQFYINACFSQKVLEQQSKVV